MVKRITALMLALLSTSALTQPEPRWVFEIDGTTIDDPRILIGLEPGGMIEVSLRREGPIPSVVGAGQSIRFETFHDYTWEASGGQLIAAGDLNAARWVLPETPGDHRLTVTGQSEYEVYQPGQVGQPQVLETPGATLTVMVLHPFDRNGPGMVDGYPIGIYPDETARRAPLPVTNHPEAYRPPPYFWRVSDQTEDRLLAPHVRLGDLGSVPEVNGVSHIAVSPLLVARLEAITRACIANAWLGADERLTILRGYLSPNRLQQLQQAGLDISEYTRHLYGDSVVVIVDRDGDGLMDDLNGDGAIDRLDAETLGEEVIRTESQFGGGGVGIYETAPTGDPELPETPMVQFDCRGARARW
jgi:hypothetical protein